MAKNLDYIPTVQLGTNVESGEPLLLYGDGLRRHRTITGLSGYGKSKLLVSLAIQLLSFNLPFICVDPHSELCEDILSILLATGFFANGQAYERLWYIRFVDPGRHPPFNWLKQPFTSQQIAANFLECCKRVWGSLDEGSSVTFENIVQAAVTVLCENRRPLTDLPRLLSDTVYRESLLANVTDSVVLEFFHTRFENYGKMALESTLRRIFLLSFSLPLRNSLGDPENIINFSRILDAGTSVLFDLGGLDEQTQRFLGVLLTVGFETAMLARATKNQAARTPTQLILDEWYQYLSQSPESLQRMLDLTRKFGMTLTLASQSLAQGREIRAALQNCLQIAFRLGHDDAKTAATRFTEQAVPAEDPPLLQDLVLSLLGVHQPYVQTDKRRTEASFWETRLKHLSKGHALVHIANQTVEVETLMIPPVANQREINRLKEEYSMRLQKPNTTKPVAAHKPMHQDTSETDQEQVLPPVDIHALRQSRLRESEMVSASPSASRIERSREHTGEKYWRPKDEIEMDMQMQSGARDIQDARPEEVTGRVAGAQPEPLEVPEPKTKLSEPATQAEPVAQKPEQIAESLDALNTLYAQMRAKAIDPDTTILASIGELYVLTIKQWMRLFTWGSYPKATQYFKELKEKGFIFRKDREGRGGKLVEGDWFFLLSKGANELLKRKQNTPLFRLEPNEAERAAGDTLVHTYLVNEIFIHLRLLERTHLDIVRIEGIDHERSMRRAYLPALGSDSKLYPDGFLRLLVPTPNGLKRRYTFLELQHTTQKDKHSWQSKVRKYLDLFRQPDTLAQYFHTRTPHVLVITMNEEYVVHHRQWTEEVLAEAGERGRAYSSRFLIGSYDAGISDMHVTPLEFFCTPRFSQPFTDTSFSVFARSERTT